MNIMENKRVIGLASLFAIAFAGTMYYGFTRSSDASAAADQLKQISEEFESYNSMEIPPSKKNLSAVTHAGKEAKATQTLLSDDFKTYSDFCVGDGRVMEATEFQNKLKSAIADISSLAADSECTLNGSAASLGFERFKNAVPVGSLVPFYAFQMSAAQRVAEHIISAGAPSLDKVYCAPVPFETDEKLYDKKFKKLPYFPLSMEVSFMARRSEVTDGKTDDKLSVIPRVLNSLAGDRDYFLTVTGIATEGVSTPPGVDAYTAPAEDTASEGSNLGSEEESAPAAAQASRPVAVRKTGSPDEFVRVHINLQVLYFNPGTAK